MPITEMEQQQKDQITRALDALGLSDDDEIHEASTATVPTDTSKVSNLSLLSRKHSGIQLRFVAPDEAKYSALLDILRSFLKEGRGEAFYTLGTGGES
jgi:hypothetical protein